MHIALFVVSGLALLFGGYMAFQGTFHNPNDLGNALIVAGTTAMIGGFLLMALAEAVRQLRRIAESLMVRPVGRMPRVNDLSPAADVPPAAPRVPFPPRTEPRRRAPMPVEPRLDMAPSIDTAADHFDRIPPAFARHAPDPSVIPERDETPLSPAAPRFTAAREERDELSEGLLATAFSRLDVSMRPTAPAAEPAKPSELFESLWPPERKAAEPAAAPEPEPPMAEHPAPVEEQPEPSEPPYAVSILKSGVVDGMAYTLYSDGSIEAEMPQGTMRFASIVELRAYLEKSPS